MNWRGLVALAHDLGAVALAWGLAFLLRFNFDLTREISEEAFRSLGWSLLAYTAIFLRMGLYRGIWRYASVDDLQRIALAGAVGGLLVAGLVHLAGLTGIPRSVLVLHPLLLVLFLGAGRFAYRVWRDRYSCSRNVEERQEVIVLGAGDAAAALTRELARSANWQVVGLLDNDLDKHGRRLGSIPILGDVAEVGKHARRLGIKTAIIAMPSASAAQRRFTAETAASAGLRVLTVPALDDILAGHVSISHIRPVELEDLLGREPIRLDEQGLSELLRDKVVLVTGAGGSIGSELCRQIFRFQPRLLVLYEQSEFALYAIGQEFASKSIACVIGDVKDEALIANTLCQYRPDIVFHAAAYKHVPLMEQDNAWQAVRNNILGTWRVARAAANHGVGEFVLISTDKAVNPTNVMGASKRLAERVCEAMEVQFPATRFVTVRFGNVLGSSGSVIPKFREQIATGGPVTVTHPDIIRYFMLIPEAAQLVLQAALQARSSGSGGMIFVLDMGEPVKIADLARDMIRLSGFTEDEIEIRFTGLRPGEKLFEELLADGETTLPTPHAKLRIVKPEHPPSPAWLAQLETWLNEPTRPSGDVREALGVFVPEYRPSNGALPGTIK